MNIKAMICSLPLFFAGGSYAVENVLAEQSLNISATLVPETCAFEGDFNFILPDEITAKELKEVQMTGGVYRVLNKEMIRYRCTGQKSASMTIIPKSDPCETRGGTYMCGGENRTVGVKPTLKLDDNVLVGVFGGRPTTKALPLNAQQEGIVRMASISFNRLRDTNIPPEPGPVFIQFAVVLWSL